MKKEKKENCCGRDGIEGSIRGPRGPKKKCFHFVHLNSDDNTGSKWCWGWWWWCLRGTTARTVKEMQNIHNMQNVQNMQNMQNVQNMQNMQIWCWPLYDIQCYHGNYNANIIMIDYNYNANMMKINYDDDVCQEQLHLLWRWDWGQLSCSRCRLCQPMISAASPSSPSSW